jgi:hypothetical protein
MEYDIEKIREVFSKLVHHTNWMSRTGRLSYDWTEGGHHNIAKLCDLLKVDLGTARLKRQDKSGAWRVMKNEKDV